MIVDYSRDSWCSNECANFNCHRQSSTIIDFYVPFDWGLSDVRRSAHRAGYRLQSVIKSDETFAVRCEIRLYGNVLDSA